MTTIGSTSIFLIGPMGAGKTSVGRSLAKSLNKHFYDSDEEIEKKMGVNLNWIVDLEGIVGFRRREFEMIADLSKLPDIVLSTGGGCVETKEVRDVLKHRGTVVYMEVSLETQLNRLRRDKKRPLLQGGDPEAVLIKLWEERETYYEDMADFIVNTDHRTVREVCDDILDWLKA